MPDKHYLSPPDFTALPAPVYFRHDEFEADTHFREHRHDWGQLNYTSHGVMHLWVEGERFLSPPRYAIWVPPNAAHGSYNPTAVTYRAVYIEASLCGELPAHPCTIAIGGILKAILVDFAERQVHIPETPEEHRLAQVVIDQLRAVPATEEARYLPYSEHPALNTILTSLRDNPADNSTLAHWARRVHLTERTLARLCHRELAMPLGEWRQRLRFLHALEALDADRSIQTIAFDLGYGSSSAFISMFRKLAGTTPERYRLSKSAVDQPR